MPTIRATSVPGRRRRSNTAFARRFSKRAWANRRFENSPGAPGGGWAKPGSACLSSRIEYGRAVTPEALRVVEQGEDALLALGFRQFRVRHHGEIVRIEIAPDELPRALSVAIAHEFARVFKALGFQFATLDLEGFRSGSMNRLLRPDELLKGTQRGV